MATFLPLVLGGGRMGDFFAVIGWVVMLALVLSIIESQLILPAHLSHRRTDRYFLQDSWLVRHWIRMQVAIAGALERFARETYLPALRRAVDNRYLTLSIGVAVVIFVVGLMASGRIVFQFFPAVEGDRVIATLTLPEGVAADQTRAAAQQLVEAARELRREMDADLALPEGESAIAHVLLSVGQQIPRNGPAMQMVSGKSNFAEVAVSLAPADLRGDRWSGQAVARRWRELTGSITDAVELSYSSAAFTTGEAINLQLEGTDVDELRAVAAALRGELSRFEGVYDITDSFRAGKQEIQLELRPEARPLGVTLSDLGRQVRQAFYGEEVQRVQRGREDVRVMVRYPESDRRSVGNLEAMRIRTPDGTEVPFSAVADFSLGRGYASIQRVDGRRVVNVVADVDRATTTPEEVIPSILDNAVPALLAEHPGVSVRMAGEQEERQESLVSLGRGAVLALLIIYTLLAIPLKSYVQPFVIMSVIPFGAIGAIAGHYLMGQALVFFSLLGIVALSGVVVNASLVLVDYVNRRRREGTDLLDAVLEAGVTRFRPIFLTSLTTFIGLVPLMLDANWATAFAIPMAISLAFGVLFATAITLFLVPSLYVVAEDWFGTLAEPDPVRGPTDPARAGAAPDPA
jgi:multidrug efflux pump subunit AcrB